MLKLEKVRNLNCSSPSTGLQSISAASGLVKMGRKVFVVADDELHLGVFPLDTHEPGSLHRLLPGELAAEKSERKKRKPDFESLIHLDAECFPPAGALLAVPSGSTGDRTVGALVAFSQNQELLKAKMIDFSLLYSTLSTHIPDLNIEGAVCTQSTVKLFQRGNGPGGVNAVVALDRDRFLDCLRYIGSVDPICLIGISRSYDLGKVQDVPLSFTDAALLAGGKIVFTAAAESTQSTSDDGECLGSAIGLIDETGNISGVQMIEHGPKIEGVFAEKAADGHLLWLVIDADQRDKPSLLFNAKLN